MLETGRKGPGMIAVPPMQAWDMGMRFCSVPPPFATLSPPGTEVGTPLGQPGTVSPLGQAEVACCSGTGNETDPSSSPFFSLPGMGSRHQAVPVSSSLRYPSLCRVVSSTVLQIVYGTFCTQKRDKAPCSV